MFWPVWSIRAQFIAVARQGRAQKNGWGPTGRLGVGSVAWRGRNNGLGCCEWGPTVSGPEYYVWSALWQLICCIGPKYVFAGIVGICRYCNRIDATYKFPWFEYLHIPAILTRCDMIPLNITVGHVVGICIHWYVCANICKYVLVFRHFFSKCCAQVHTVAICRYLSVFFLVCSIQPLSMCNYS